MTTVGSTLSALNVQPAYPGYGLAKLLREAWIEYERDRARYLAAAMVYYAMVSLVPLLLLLLATLGLLLRFSETAVEAERQMLLAIEANFGEQLPQTIEGLLGTLQQESIVATVISLVGLLVTASVLFKHLRLSFRAIWKHDPPLISGSVRGVVWATLLERAKAFVMVLGGGGLLLAALVLIAATQWLNPLLGRVPLLDPVTGWVVPAVSSLILAAITFAALFKLLPSVPVRWRDVWLPVLLCAVAWVAAGEFLTFYAASFGGGPYGAIGSLLAVMLWMNIVSQVLFFGAELCKAGATREGTSQARGLARS